MMAVSFLKSSTLVLQYMRKSDRLFQVVNLIRVHQPITAEDLAGRIGVSVRTIYRYVDDLSVSGIPLYGVAGVGYALHEGFELPPLTLTQDELDALMLGVEMLSNSAGAELASSARTLLSKVAAALPLRNTEPSFSNIRALRVKPVTPDQRCLDELHRAIQQAKAVRFSYFSLSGEASDRTVFPLGLFYWGGKWTVGTWCTSRKAYRDFRVDRIQSLQIMTGGQKLEAQWNLRSYMQFQSDQWAAQQSFQH
jgi:predicted DNA-binding transcriptional regulator YafY